MVQIPTPALPPVPQRSASVPPVPQPPQLPPVTIPQMPARRGEADDLGLLLAMMGEERQSRDQLAAGYEQSVREEEFSPLADKWTKRLGHTATHEQAQILELLGLPDDASQDVLDDAVRAVNLMKDRGQLSSEVFFWMKEQHPEIELSAELGLPVEPDPPPPSVSEQAAQIREEGGDRFFSPTFQAEAFAERAKGTDSFGSLIAQTGLAGLRKGFAEGVAKFDEASRGSYDERVMEEMQKLTGRKDGEGPFDELGRLAGYGPSEEGEASVGTRIYADLQEASGRPWTIDPREYGGDFGLARGYLANSAIKWADFFEGFGSGMGQDRPELFQEQIAESSAVLTPPPPPLSGSALDDERHAETRALIEMSTPEGNDPSTLSEVGLGQNVGGIVGTVFDNIMRPFHASMARERNIELAALGLEPLNPNGAAWDGFTLERRDTYMDILLDHGVQDPVILFMASLPVEIAMDPVTALGATGLARAVSKGVSHSIFGATSAAIRHAPPRIAGAMDTALAIVRVAKNPTGANLSFYRLGQEHLLRTWIERYGRRMGQITGQIDMQDARRIVKELNESMTPEQLAAMTAELDVGTEVWLAANPDLADPIMAKWTNRKQVAVRAGAERRAGLNVEDRMPDPTMPLGPGAEVPLGPPKATVGPQYSPAERALQENPAWTPEATAKFRERTAGVRDQAPFGPPAPKAEPVVTRAPRPPATASLVRTATGTTSTEIFRGDVPTGINRFNRRMARTQAVNRELLTSESMAGQTIPLGTGQTLRQAAPTPARRAPPANVLSPDEAAAAGAARNRGFRAAPERRPVGPDGLEWDGSGLAPPRAATAARVAGEVAEEVIDPATARMGRYGRVATPPKPSGPSLPPTRALEHVREAVQASGTEPLRHAIGGRSEANIVDYVAHYRIGKLPESEMRGIGGFFRRLFGLDEKFISPEDLRGTGIRDITGRPSHMQQRKIQEPIAGTAQLTPADIAIEVDLAQRRKAYNLLWAVTDVIQQNGFAVHIDDINTMRRVLGREVAGLTDEQAAKRLLVENGTLTAKQAEGVTMVLLDDVGANKGKTLVRNLANHRPGTLWGQTREVLSGKAPKDAKFATAAPGTATMVALPTPYAKFMTQLLDASDFGGFVRLYDAHLNFWKRANTVWAPLFHTRNGASNLYLNWLGGVANPKWYYEAMQIQKGARDGRMWGVEGVERISTADLIRRMEIQQVTRTGIVGEMQYHMGTKNATVAERRIKEWVKVGGNSALFGTEAYRAGISGLRGWDRVKYIYDSLPGAPTGSRSWGKMGMTLGGAIEDNAKIAHVLAKLSGGMTVNQAFDSSKMWLYNYAALTPIERKVFRRVIPFYAWQRHNVPRMLDAMFTQPHKVQMTQFFIRDAAGAISSAAGMDQRELAAAMALMPEFFQRIGGWVFGRDEAGNVKILRGQFGLPTEDIGMAAPFVDPAEWLDNFLSQLAPYASVLSAGIMEHSLFTGESTSEQSSGNFFTRTDANTFKMYKASDGALRYAEPFLGPLGGAVKDFREEFLGVREQQYVDARGNTRTSYLVRNPWFYAFATSLVQMTGAGRVGSSVRQLSDPRKSVADRIIGQFLPLKITSVDVTRKALNYYAGDATVWDHQLGHLSNQLEIQKLGGPNSMSIEKFLDTVYGPAVRNAYAFSQAQGRGLTQDPDFAQREAFRRMVLPPVQLALEAYRDGNPDWLRHKDWAPGGPPLHENGLKNWDGFFEWRDEFLEDPYAWMSERRHADGTPYVSFTGPDARQQIEGFNEQVAFQIKGGEGSLARRADKLGYDDVARFERWRQYAYKSYETYLDIDRWNRPELNAVADEAREYEVTYQELNRTSMIQAKMYRERGILFERAPGGAWVETGAVNPRIPAILQGAGSWDRKYANPQRRIYRARHPELTIFGLGARVSGFFDPSIIYTTDPPEEQGVVPELPPADYSRSSMEGVFAGG
jgi:hypothetical protein